MRRGIWIFMMVGVLSTVCGRAVAAPGCCVIDIFPGLCIEEDYVLVCKATKAALSTICSDNVEPEDCDTTPVYSECSMEGQVCNKTHRQHHENEPCSNFASCGF